MASTPPIPGIRRSIRITSTSTGGEADGLGAVTGFADDLEVGVIGEHAAQPVAHDGVVVDDQQPDGVIGRLQAAARRAALPR
jgi:hypothetical protein